MDEPRNEIFSASDLMASVLAESPRYLWTRQSTRLAARSRPWPVTTMSLHKKIQSVNHIHIPDNEI